MGAQGTDVLLSARAKAWFPYAVEAKNQEAIGPLYKFWEQTLDNTIGEDIQSVLIVKRAHSKPLAIIDAEHFFELTEAAAYKGRI